jgi:hypothetical protein
MEERERKTEVKCKKCGEKIPKKDLQFHLQNHSNDGKEPCFLCKLRVSDLIRHLGSKKHRRKVKKRARKKARKENSKEESEGEENDDDLPPLLEEQDLVMDDSHDAAEVCFLPLPNLANFFQFDLAEWIHAISIANLEPSPSVVDEQQYATEPEPVVPEALETNESAMILAGWWRKHNVTKGAMADLLVTSSFNLINTLFFLHFYSIFLFFKQNIFQNTAFVQREAPRSVYLLEQLEQLVLPGINRYVYKDKGGVNVYHFDVFEYLALILDKEDKDLKCLSMMKMMA